MFTIAIKDETFCIRDKETFMAAVGRMYDEMLLDTKAQIIEEDPWKEILTQTGFEDKEALGIWIQDACDYGILTPSIELKYSLEEYVNDRVREEISKHSGDYQDYQDLDDVFDRIDCLEEAIDNIYYTADEVR